jgi:glycosyltransferase involved in cell wall biosynthesis
LGHLLARAGHDVRAYAPTSSLPPSEKRTLVHSSVSVTRFGAHKRVDDTLVDWFELIAEEHRREPFDLLQGYFLPQAGFVTAYAGKYLNLPSVASIRGNDIERAAFDPSRFSHVMYALQNANALTTNASELARKARAFVDREIILIPNGVDAELFKPMERNEILAQAIGIGDASVIGFVGELREKKGLASLLNSYAQVNKKQPVTLLIVGEARAGEDKARFDEIKSSAPNANIIVTGYVAHADLPAYYALMDVFVHPSLRDGMPNAALEAMACGKTVIATAVGGLTNVIEDGVNGILIQPNETGSLGVVIAEALNQPQKRDQLGRSAREAVLHQFTLERELQANLAIYQSLGVVK